jgi:bacterioferritin-associated ferredoxin
LLKAIVIFNAMYVCICHGVSDRTIRSAIERGACSPEAIAACTGAGTKCGRCRPEIAAIVAAALQEPGTDAAEREARFHLPVRREQTAA